MIKNTFARKKTKEDLINKWSNIKNSEIFINASFESLYFKNTKKIKEIVNYILEKIETKEFKIEILYSLSEKFYRLGKVKLLEKDYSAYSYCCAMNIYLTTICDYIESNKGFVIN